MLLLTGDIDRCSGIIRGVIGHDTSVDALLSGIEDVSIASEVIIQYSHTPFNDC